MSLQPSSQNRRPARLLVAFWLGLGGLSGSGSQANPPAPLEGVVVRAWGTEAGLPQNTVNTIIQTRDGYLWLGTQDGLARFDGVRFTVFGLREGLPNLEVQALYEDGDGTLWIGTGGGGLCRFVNGQIGCIPGFHHLVGEIVSSLAGDSAGTIWIGTRTGLSVARGGTLITNEAAVTLQRTAIQALLRGHDGAMWIATARQGLYEFKDNAITEIGGPSGNEQILAYCLLEDRDGALWASVGNGKVLCRHNGTWRTYSQADGLPFAYVTSLTEAADGTIWAGSLDDGLYHLEAGRFIAVRKEDGLSANDIRSLLLDGEGNLWVGTRTGGLDRVNYREFICCGAAQGLTNDFTRSVAESPDGKLWVGTIGGGLYKGTMERFVRSDHERGDFWYAFVDSVLAASDGSIWYGARTALMRLQDQRLSLVYTNDTWLRSASVTALCEDLKGGLWIGTSEGSLEHLQGQGFVAFPPSIAQGPINALAQQPNGFVWVGSEGGGLKRIRDGSNAVLSVTDVLLSQAIRALYLDAKGTLWIGTAGGGLSCRRNDGRVAAFTSQQGLVANTVSQIVEDDYGFLWLGTTRGVLRIRKSDLEEVAVGRLSFVQPHAFGIYEGMPAEECSSGFCPSGLKTKGGLVCFSTVKGLVFFDPRRQVTNSPPPRVLLEEVLVNGEVRAPELEETGTRVTSAAAGSHSSPTAGQITLAPGSRELELHYTGINFGAPDKLRFRYQLKGLDPGWVEAAQRRSAHYSHLPTGEFLFRVLACNADGVWSSNGPALAVTVEPYLWQVTWFQAMALVAALGVMAGAVRLLERRQYRRRLALIEARHAVEKERLRISQDMHDDIGSVLTQVSQLSDFGQSEAGDAAAAKGHFERIGKHARAAVQALEEIVWATNPKNDTVPRFAEYVCQFADEMFRSGTLRCWLDVPTTLPTVPLGADTRHNVLLALKEAFNNVLKHSGATEVWLRLGLQNSEVCVSVEDNGHGFEREQIGPGGNGLENMKTRLAGCGGRMELVSAPGAGTKIRFLFPLPRPALPV